MGNYINTKDLELEVSYYLQCEKESETITLEELKEIINRLPSADVVEAKHGEWIEDDNYAICSLCAVAFNKKENDWEWFHFCPQCGADMRGGITE